MLYDEKCSYNSLKITVVHTSHEPYKAHKIEGYHHITILD